MSHISVEISLFKINEIDIRYLSIMLYNIIITN